MNEIRFLALLQFLTLALTANAKIIEGEVQGIAEASFAPYIAEGDAYLLRFSVNTDAVATSAAGGSRSITEDGFTASLSVNGGDNLLGTVLGCAARDINDSSLPLIELLSDAVACQVLIATPATIYESFNFAVMIPDTLPNLIPDRPLIDLVPEDITAASMIFVFDNPSELEFRYSNIATTVPVTSVFDKVVRQLENLAEIVVQVNIQAGISNSLDGKLGAALNALDDTNENNDGAAINSIYAFCSSVEAQRGKKLTNDQASQLIDAANSIISSLDNFAVPCQ